MKETRTRRFAVLKAGTAHQSTVNPRGGFGDMMIAAFSKPGEPWDIYDVEHGIFPEDISGYDGFVITGSQHSAYDALPWVKQLLNIIQEIYRQRIPLVGICFGHQAIAYGLGGEVRDNPRGWDVGVGDVYLTETARMHAAFRDSPQPIRILEVHHDAVTRLPPGAMQLAFSDHTAHEMYLVDSVVFGIQGHPEFDTETIRELIELLRTTGELASGQAEESLASLSQEPHQEFLRSMVRKFLSDPHSFRGC